ncbi:concanavalin A-like lectin/glucanase domain-containing protein [Coniochaeta sp. 2T2.1]|nr:concanavalin A-like lectin/glucanase domain-containing protein [Coniochaeta sp. 2T2.1]
MHRSQTPRDPTDSSRSTSVSSFPQEGKRLFVSYRLNGAYEKPWVSDPKIKSVRRGNYIVYGFLAIGFACAAAIAFLITKPAVSGPLCLVLDEDFKTLNKDIWSHEVTLDGFGTGSFDWTTTDPKNTYVDDAGLHIVPTLTNETTTITNDQIYSGYTLNLTSDGSCTGAVNTSACYIHSNSTLGSLIPPVRSARITTKGRVGIRYGRVEVTAKLPKGDWLWPAIWMMPEDSAYGVWPRSGEIDIMEARGNDMDYPGGRNIFFSTLHWGPSSETDSYWQTMAVRVKRRTDFADGFHTFGLEWTDKHIYTYYDSRLTQVFYTDFTAHNPMWSRGSFAEKSENNSLFTNPWETSTSTTGNAPFDKKFYLILNVAVGSRNGWFLDNVGQKPWVDAATNAQWTFWSNADKWLPTWGEGDARGMTVKSVKMWQSGSCGATEL